MRRPNPPSASTGRALAALAAVLAAAPGVPTTARAQSPTTEDLRRQIQSLQQQVDDLQRARATTPAYTAKDVDAAVDSVIRDADRRSRLLDETSGFYGGFIDDKFTIRSADGNYSLSPNLWLQFRQVTNDRQDLAAAAGDDNTDNGFEIRRAKFGFDGNAFTKDFYYNFIWATDRRTGNVLLEEAYLRYKFADRFTVKAGQYKELVAQDVSVSSRRKLAVDVSLLTSFLFAGDTYTQGVELAYDNQRALQAWVGFSDGFNSANTNLQDPPTTPFDFGFYGRAQYKLFGDWKSYADFTPLGNKKDLLVVGAGADWSQNGDQNVVRHAVDIQWETAGPLAAFAAFHGRYTDDHSAAAADWDYGAVAQASYLFNLQWELFGRYDFLKLATPTAAGEDTYHEFTVGLNYYIHKHNLKFTLDATWLPNGAPANQDAIGVLANDGNPEYLLRAQLQFFL